LGLEDWDYWLDYICIQLAVFEHRLELAQLQGVFVKCLVYLWLQNLSCVHHDAQVPVVLCVDGQVLLHGLHKADRATKGCQHLMLVTRAESSTGLDFCLNLCKLANLTHVTQS
jgi:hypothetical protein